MTMRLLSSGAMLLLALLGFARGTVAQPATADLFSQSVEVRVVNVDVHVTDRKGRPIADLVKDDFVLLVDGQETDIKYFRATRGEPIVPDPPIESPVIAAETPTAPAVTPEADGLLVVLYLDLYWLGIGERARLLHDIEQFVAGQEGSNLRFLVVSYDPGLNIRAPITTEPGVVLEALAALPDTPTHGDEMRRERSSAYREINSIYQACEAICECAFDPMLAVWERFAQSVTHRMRVTNDGLSDLLAA